jgi:predicted site-specific integrase-resolvase
MALTIDGKVYYKTSEACKNTGISRATLFRRLKIGILEKYRTDRRGWRLFTEEDLNRIRAEAGKIKIEDSFQGGRNDKS